MKHGCYHILLSSPGKNVGLGDGTEQENQVSINVKQLIRSLRPLEGFIGNSQGPSGLPCKFDANLW